MSARPVVAPSPSRSAQRLGRGLERQEGPAGGQGAAAGSRLLRTLQQAQQQKAVFQRWCRTRGYEDAAKLIDQDWDRMTAFYAFPREHWTHLRTTNSVESPFAALRLRTDAGKRFKPVVSVAEPKVENATAVIWKMLLMAESRFRRLNAQQLLQELFEGAVYVNGIRVSDQPERLAA